MSIALLHYHARSRQYMAAVPFTDLTVARIQSGLKRLADGSQRGEVEPGHYLVVSPGHLLNVENLPATDGPYRSSCLAISRELLQKAWPADVTPTRWTVLHPYPVLDQAFAHTEQGLREQLPEAVLVHRVRELVEALGLGGFRPSWTNELGTTERVRLVLAATPECDLRAENIATQLAMSTATLRRRLAAEGTSFRAVMEEVRLTRALTLIQTTALPLKHIAEDCGYLSASRFATRFRMRFGSLPSELRE